MYKVFVNKNPIILTSNLAEEQDSKYFLLDSVDIQTVINTFKDKALKTVFLYDKNQATLLEKFKKKLAVVEAAGGLVKNPKGDNLFIYRKDKWDLPKGKLEAKETPEVAAIREVEEETGISKLKIIRFLADTYHIFKRNGRYQLKITHWFLMHSTHNGTFVPQLEEDICEVVWKNSNETKQALLNSYPNIKQLFMLLT